MQPELLVSDFAGTLMLEEGVVADAYRVAFARQEIEYSEADIVARRGANKLGVFRDLAARTYPVDEVEQVARSGLAIFQAELERNYLEQPVEPIPGAEQALHALNVAGIKLAVSSGFPRDLMLSLVERLGWTGLFGTAVSGDDVPMGRPAPYIVFKAMMDLGVQDVRQVAVVGDTALDLEAGNRAGAGWVIGVLSGAHDLDTLGAVRHTHLLSSVAELPRLVDLS
ncbi:phosphonatase-like hydrolase [soil metagenome]